MNDTDKKYIEIFLPHLFKEQFPSNGIRPRLVHYTNAEAAMNIIRSQEFWMRESSCMNDRSEVSHGLNCVKAAYASEKGLALKSFLNSIYPKITDEIENFFNSWQNYFLAGTYLASFSKHYTSEDKHGRLSMWRGYSEGSGVALVLNSDVFFEETDVFTGLYTIPVLYADDIDFANRLSDMQENMTTNISFIKKQSKETLVRLVFMSLMFSALCTKHPGFSEEDEWRLVYCPMFEKSAAILTDIVSIRGTPQTIYKIPLKNFPEQGLTGLKIPELFERIIIGPSEYPLALHKAFATSLKSTGISNPEGMIHISEIPLRL